MFQSSHKSVDIEMQAHQERHGLWKCDYTLIRDPNQTQTTYGDEEFATMDMAKEYALREARVAIDRDGE